ncbi:MAG: glycoside hydrolase [Acidobacteria bacterium]|nr:MAG: glycoside hydrolase [Acidobacteriota bacterium]
MSNVEVSAKSKIPKTECRLCSRLFPYFVIRHSIFDIRYSAFRWEAPFAASQTVHWIRFLFVRAVVVLIGANIIWALPALGVDGQVQIHDPSTIIECGGKYYTYGTGGSCLVSDDGWTWYRGVSPTRRGMAPDMIHLGDRYNLYVAANIGAQPKAAINMIWNKTLDPGSPDYKWEEGGIVASSDGVEFCNAIDPGVFLDPTDGKLWLVYGSYFGYIRLVQLDPKTGKRIDPNDKPVDIAVNCEAPDMIYHQGWYYLLATHGSCCRGADSGYNIRVGRARKVTGPFLDHMGVDMLQGGGKLVVGSGGRVIGPGHFGLINLGDGVQKFSCHYEADLDRGGASVLDIRPLLWRDGWPVAGDSFKEGTYAIESVRTGTALELAVEGMPVGGRRNRRPPGGPGAAPGGPGGPGGGLFSSQGGVIPPQDVAQVSTNWPAGNIDIRMGNYLCQAQQKWTVTPVADAGGYPGSPYFKITIAGTGRVLAVDEEGELVALPAFTGGPEQLWRLDQLPDGAWRIMPKSASDAGESLALSAIGSSFATLQEFDPASNKQRWLFKTP